MDAEKAALKDYEFRCYKFRSEASRRVRRRMRRIAKRKGRIEAFR